MRHAAWKIVAGCLVLLTSGSFCGAQASPMATDCAAVKAMADHASMDHTAHAAALAKCDARPLPTMSGQAAFAAITEIVRLLDADSATDWSKVNIEALRQHLIDMDEVTMRSSIAQRNIDGGAVFEVTGTGRTVMAIRRLAASHARMIGQEGIYRTNEVEIPDGARVTITLVNAANSAAVARLRGLGYAGLLTEGNHHAAHHLALARGDADPHSR
jgi:hypothetical protein